MENVHVFLKEDIPDRYHWKRNSRITEIVLFGKTQNQSSQNTNSNFKLIMVGRSGNVKNGIRYGYLIKIDLKKTSEFS